MTDQQDIDLMLKMLSEHPRDTYAIDTSSMTEADDPVGFIAEVRAMQRFGCVVTVTGSVVVLEGPSPIVRAIRQALAMVEPEGTG